VRSCMPLAWRFVDIVVQKAEQALDIDTARIASGNIPRGRYWAAYVRGDGILSTASRFFCPRRCSTAVDGGWQRSEDPRKLGPAD
jgi:hypothetical protein